MSDQTCSAGQTITGVTDAGIITCADMVPAPPTCDQNNQSWQYNAGTGWACMTKNHNIIWSQVQQIQIPSQRELRGQICLI